MLNTKSLIATVFLLSLAASVQSDDWPQWRGPRRDEVSRETGLLHEWRSTPPLAWRAAGLGGGYSSVVTSDGVVYTMGNHGADLFAFAIDEATGKPVWNRNIGTTSRHPCSTPTIDGDRIYFLDPDGELLCLKITTGEPVWERSFSEEFGGKMMSGRGYGESPLIDGDRLICTPGGPEAMMVALDKQTGETIWQATIPELGPNGQDGHSFPSVVISEAAGIKQYVQLVGRGLVGIEAETGKFLWGHNAIANRTANIPTPVVDRDLVFVANGYHAGCVLLKLTSDGDGGIKAEPVYAHRGSRFQNHHGGVVLVGGNIYGGHGSNNGLPTCLDFESGKIRWKRRGPGTGSAAVTYADGRLYFRYQNGLVALIEANEREFRLKGTFQIPTAGGDSWSHPVVSNGRLLLREKDHLFAYDIRRGSADSSPTAPANLVRGSQADQLRTIGVAIESINAESPNVAPSIRRLLRYVLDDDAADDASVLLVTAKSEHVEKDGTLAETVVAPLSKLDRPLILSLAGTAVSGQGLRQISKLDGLVGLNLELCPEVTDASLAELNEASALRALWLIGTPITNDCIQHLMLLKNLIALDLDICDGVDNASCSLLAQLQQLKALVLKKTAFEKSSVEDDGLAELRHLKQLDLLDIEGNKVTDQGLEHLSNMKSLRELSLNRLGITDKGIAHLIRLPNLMHLDLVYSTGFGGPMLTDTGVESLGQIGSLRSLNVSGAKITDASIDRLVKLRELRRVHLVSTGVTPAGVDRLKSALPKCEVIR